MPILTPAYFTSAWTTAEWRTFQLRESFAGPGTRLIIPVALRSPDRYPPYAKARQFFDATEFPARASDWTSENIRSVRSLAEQIARMLDEVPPFHPDFPHVEPEDVEPDQLQKPGLLPRL
jgi:hypothetical protein